MLNQVHVTSQFSKDSTRSRLLWVVHLDKMLWKLCSVVREVTPVRNQSIERCEINLAFIPAPEYCFLRDDAVITIWKFVIINNSYLQDLNKHTEADPSAKGIKDFWLTVLRTHDLVAATIEEHDAPILSFLTDVTTAASQDPPVSCSWEVSSR